MKTFFCIVFLLSLLQSTSQNLSFEDIDSNTEKVDFSEDFAFKSVNNKDLVKDKAFEELVKSADFSYSWNMTKNVVGDNRQDWNISSHQGIFGNDYYRIDFFIYDVTKSDTNPLLYFVKGKTRLKGNICDFRGEIEIITTRMRQGTGTSVSYSQYFSDTVYMGVIIADYKFFEDSNQYGSGVFKGKYASGVFVYPNYLSYSGIGSWDEIRATEMLGTFVGTWKSYTSNNIKKCIWNYYTYDFPYSGDFHEIPIEEINERNREIESIETPLTADQLFGKGINPKYRNNGWDVHPKEYNNNWWK